MVHETCRKTGVGSSDKHRVKWADERVDEAVTYMYMSAQSELTCAFKMVFAIVC